MSKRTKWLLGIGVIATVIFGLQVAAYAFEAALPGSKFEIDNNANLKHEGPTPPAADATTEWDDLAHPSGPEFRSTDVATGSQDDSYKGGVKETTECPNQTTGSIPNNKSDLLTFHVYEEEGTTPGDPGFLNLAWSRVSDPSGTTLMDFEFNQGSPDNPADLCSQGPNVQRTDGDLLIEYEIDQGGARAAIFGRLWNDTTNTWGPRQDLAQGTACDGGPCAVGTINNTSALLEQDTDGLGPKALRTFGEAQIDLDFIPPSEGCTTFGSGMAKSRSSDADRSQLKDFIKPIGIDVGSCGTVKVIKNDDTPAPEGPNPLDDAEFDLVKDNAPFGTPVDTQTAPGAEDIGTAQTPIPPVDSCVTVAGECEFNDVLEGEYWVIETLAPPGHELADPAFKHVTVAADGTVEVTFVNPRLVSTLATAPSVIPNDTATVGTDGEDGKYEGTLTFELFDNLDECTAEDNDADAVYSEAVDVPADTDPGTDFSTDNPGVPSAAGENDGFTINSGNDTTYYWQVSYDDTQRTDAVSDCVESTVVTITDDN